MGRQVIETGLRFAVRDATGKTCCAGDPRTFCAACRDAVTKAAQPTPASPHPLSDFTAPPAPELGAFASGAAVAGYAPGDAPTVSRFAPTPPPPAALEPPPPPPTIEDWKRAAK